MRSIVVTGSSGLIGSEVCTYFARVGYRIHGLDNNQRAAFFGPQGDTRWNQHRLEQQLSHFTHHEIDIRDRVAVLALIERLRPSAIVHTAAQPSHDRAAAIPFEDFDTNAVGTLNLLDRARESRAATRVTLAVLVSWLVVGAAGVDRLTGQSLANLTVWRQYFAAHAANVRQFVITGEVAEFKAKRPLVELPYPNPESLVTRLQDPDIRRILPTWIREPIRLQPRTITAAFVPEALDVPIPHDSLARGWLSLSGEGRKAQGRFESAPTGPCRAGGHLAFQVSGYLGWKGQYLAVKDLRTGIERAVSPSRVAKESWVEATVPCPEGPFAIVAIDAASDSWFGFREPVEIGWLSPWVESLIGSSRALLFAALALAVLAARWT